MWQDVLRRQKLEFNFESEYNISGLQKLSYGLARHGFNFSSFAYLPHEVQATQL